jgi:1,4-dihydroxy-2-naphthoate octaprenyltransferase
MQPISASPSNDARQSAEPAPGRFPNRALTLLAATRPAFLSVTGLAVVLGIACAWHDLGRIDAASAIATLFFALVAHAGTNVINDYYDHLNGTDEANTERVFPFTGGSRFIQNGVLSAAQTRVFGYALLAMVIPAGIALTWHAGAGLLPIGLAGLLIGWAYSATPLELNSRGFGEPCVTAGMLCIVLGADYVQRGAYAITPLAAGLPYALIVTNILLINQFPDRKADIQAGKLHWVARLPLQCARWIYVGFLVLYAATLLLFARVTGDLPGPAVAALLALLPGAFAARQLLRHAGTPGLLAPAIRATIVSALAAGLLLTAAMLTSR